MLIALVAAVSPLAQDPVSQDPGALHPGDAFLVVQAPDVQALRAAYAGTALARTLADESLHEAIGRVMDGPPLDPVAMALDAYRAEVDAGESPPILELLDGISAASVSVTLAGGDPIAFFEGMDSAGDESAFAASGMGLRVVVDFVDEPARERMDALLDGALAEELPDGIELRSRAIEAPTDGPAFGSGTITVRSVAVTDPGADRDALGESLRVASGGTRVAITMGNVDFDAALRSFASGRLDGSAAELFAPGRASFGAIAGAPMAELYVQPFVERALAMEAPEALPLLDVTEGIFGPMASMVIRGGHWRIAIEEGQFITQGVHEPGAGGPMSGLIGTKELGPAALQLAHPDALVTSVTSFDGDVLAEVIRTALPAEGEGSLAFLEDTYGFRPDVDIAGALGDAISYSLPTLRSLLSAPNLMGAAALVDRNAFIRGMDGLFAMTEDLGGDVQVQRSEYRGSMVYTLSFTNMMSGMDGLQGLPIDPASFFRPTVTVMDDRVLLTTLPTHAKKEIRRVAKALKSEEAPGVHAAIAAMGVPEGATTVGYADWPTFFGNFYTQLRSLAPMLAGMGGELPFDLNALPEAELLTKYFQPSQRWVRRRSDGAVQHEAKSSIGPEIAIAPMSAALGVATSMRAFGQSFDDEVVVEEWAVEANDPVSGEIEPDAPSGELAAARTQESLVAIAVAIRLYELDHAGGSPGSLADLLQTTDSYPGGYLEGGSVPTDAWGRAFVYERKDDGYALRSMGANGVDDAGAGDDLTID
ncbi:MAG: type II secretion system protein GspG [Planctomycetota bacterium]